MVTIFLYFEVGKVCRYEILVSRTGVETITKIIYLGYHGNKMLKTIFPKIRMVEFLVSC